MSNLYTPAQILPVIDGREFAVVNGANLGDGLSFAEDLVLDDVYRLAPRAQRQHLSLHSDGDQFRISARSCLGEPEATVFLDCALTLMTTQGDTVDVLVLVELEDTGLVAASYLVPLSDLHQQTDYALVGIDTETARQKLAQIACMSFTRGTRITMGNGAQIPIEHLQVGDRVLTRDAGVQDIRWIGHSTARATGEFAPIRIKAGVLNNMDDLIVSPDHRLFIYQRSDRIGAGRSELLVKARHLVNGDSITVIQGGFVDYFQLLFDHHQIIYAEGIAAESLLIDDRTAPAIPADLSDKLVAGRPDRPDTLSGFDVSETLLDRPDAAEVLRRASTR